MKVILINPRHGGSRAIELGRWSRALVSLCCLGLPLGILAAGYFAGQESEARSLRGATLDQLQDDLAEQSGDLDAIKGMAERQMQAMSLNLAELQARMTRIDALGQHLTAMADLEDGEFDFSQPPALGGPLGGEFNVEFIATDLDSELARFESQLADREQQLDILQRMLTNRELREQRFLSGRPVRKGWISSHYGQRTDPFSGKPAMHNGLDFAGKEGADVVAVAAGVVTWTGTKNGYGELVEVSHADGFVTRYAHNKQNLVEQGDVVRKGDTIALMGSSGRSTGAHVHYEVYKHGRAVDPSSYVARTRR
ncbi:MAG: murein DD-endopeptidase MepM/ murein hydrolase activator NlpD [Bacteroidia bacterium]|jgi:murein DD-endopeptidase MepM/ murein hydrolase activator NlpD